MKNNSLRNIMWDCGVQYLLTPKKVNFCTYDIIVLLKSAFDRFSKKNKLYIYIYVVM